MEVQLIESRPFPGWAKFLARLSSVRPEHALGWVQIFTKNIAAHNAGVFRGQSPVIPITLHVILREWIRGLEAGVLPAIDATTHGNCHRGWHPPPPRDYRTSSLGNVAAQQND